MTMTIKEFATLGGKARWKGTKKKDRSKAMSELARLSWKNRKRAKKVGSTQQLQHAEVLRQAISKKPLTASKHGSMIEKD